MNYQHPNPKFTFKIKQSNNLSFLDVLNFRFYLQRKQ